MPVDSNAPVRISAFNWVPPFAQGQVRDLRPRWALEEAGIAYAVRKLDAMAERPADYYEEQPFGQVLDRGYLARRARTVRPQLAIRKFRVPPGSSKPSTDSASVEEVARRYGVNRATIHRAIGLGANRRPKPSPDLAALPRLPPPARPALQP
jgi:hypothetical protein